VCVRVRHVAPLITSCVAHVSEPSIEILLHECIAASNAVEVSPLNMQVCNRMMVEASAFITLEGSVLGSLLHDDSNIDEKKI